MNNSFPLISKVYFLTVLLVISCNEADIPLYQPQPTVQSRTIGVYFRDLSKEHSSIAIYINNTLLKDQNGNTKGLLPFAVPDSLKERSYTITLAEYDTPEAPHTLVNEGIIYEVLLLPEDISMLNSILFTRQDVFSPITERRIKIDKNEVASAPGYLKVRFYNVSSSIVTIETRKDTIQQYIDLKPFEERAFVELPFGEYRFLTRNEEGKLVGVSDEPELLRGAAGKSYIVVFGDQNQQIIESQDLGAPLSGFAHLGIVNLIAGSNVKVEAIPGSSRSSSKTFPYTRFDNTELIKSGSMTFKATINNKVISKEYNLPSWSYVMAYIIQKKGEPDIQFIHYPMVESGEIPFTAYIKYLNFSNKISEVTFSRVLDLTTIASENIPVNVLTPEYSSNLLFGEEAGTYFTEKPNSAYAIYGPDAQIPLAIQGHVSLSDPFGLGKYITSTRAIYPYFIYKPDLPIETYSGNNGDSGIYSTILLDGSSADPDSSSILIIKHSF